MPFPEYLNTDNSTNLRGWSPETLRWIQSQRNSESYSPQPSGGNWNAPIRYGSSELGYTARTDPQEIAAMENAARISATIPSNIRPPALDQAALEAAQWRNHPLVNGMSDSDILAAQLARNPSGDVRRILASMQGKGPDFIGPQQTMTDDVPFQGPTESGAPMTAKLWGEPIQNLKAYHPQGGFGGSSSSDSMRSSLDITLVSHPEFAKLLQKDPHKAQAVYQALTGRDFAGDVKTDTDIQNSRDRFKAATVQKMISEGAYVEPTTGKVMEWSMGEPEVDPNALPGTRPAQASRKLQEASSDKQQIWQEMYSRVTGKPLTKVAEGKVTAKRLEGFDTNNAVLNSPAISNIVKQAETKLGYTMNAKEKTLYLQKIMKQRPDLVGGQMGGNLQDSNPGAFSFMGGLHNIIHQGVVDPLQGALDALYNDSNSSVPPRPTTPLGINLSRSDRYYP